MPFGTITLRDGNKVPAIAFGTGSVNKGRDITLFVKQALECGFTHLDTAAYYQNESSVGNAIKELGVKRESVFITTKFPYGEVSKSIQHSLEEMGIDYVDLYLIHHPRLIPDIAGVWREFEDLKEAGVVKSIGVSNFTLLQLQELVKTASVTPAVIQIDFDMYKYRENKAMLDYAKKHSILVEGYNCLSPLKYPGGPADHVLAKAAARLNCSMTQVCLAWVKSKGVVIVTTSSKKEHLQEYLAVADLELTKGEIAAIDDAAMRTVPISVLLMYHYTRATEVLGVVSKALSVMILSAVLCWLLLQILQEYLLI